MPTAKELGLAKRRADRLFKAAWDKRNGERPNVPPSLHVDASKETKLRREPESLGEGFDEDTPLLPAAALDKSRPDGERLAALAPQVYDRWNRRDVQPD